jgi:hypothetical protein
MIPSLRAVLSGAAVRWRRSRRRAKQSPPRDGDCFVGLGFDMPFAKCAQGYSTISPPRNDGMASL